MAGNGNGLGRRIGIIGGVIGTLVAFGGAVTYFESLYTRTEELAGEMERYRDDIVGAFAADASFQANWAEEDREKHGQVMGGLDKVEGMLHTFNADIQHGLGVHHEQHEQLRELIEILRSVERDHQRHSTQ